MDLLHNHFWSGQVLIRYRATFLRPTFDRYVSALFVTVAFLCCGSTISVTDLPEQMHDRVNLEEAKSNLSRSTLSV